MICNGCGFIGRVASGFLARRWGVRPVLITSTFVCVVMIFGMIGLSSVASAVVIAVIFGLFAGACTLVSPSVWVASSSD